MKKRLLKGFALIFVSLGISLGSIAQVSSYTFTQGSGTYDEISGGTLIATATDNTSSGSLDFTLFQNQLLDFPFMFNGTSYSSINVSCDGNITFGTQTTNSATPISATTAYSGAIAAWARDINGFFDISGFTSDIRMETIGTAPNREIVIQWKNFRPLYSTSTTNVYSFDFQIRLEETTNVINVVYGPNAFLIGSTAQTGTVTTGPQVGLRGATNTDYNNRTGLSWAASNAGTGNGNRMAFSTTDNFPSSGLIFSWAPPACFPASNLTATNLTQTTGTVSWTSGASSFNIEWSTIPFTPGNGEEEGVATSATNSYDFTGLIEGTTYYVAVQVDCGVDGLSTWSTPISFTTPSTGQTCEVAMPIASLPYTTTDNTSNYGDNYNGSPGASGCGTTSSYLNGDDVVYSFTADFDGIVNLSMTPTNTWSGVFVYESCADIGVACYAGQANSTSTERNFDLNVINGNTYYIVISTFAAPQNTGYTLTLTQVTCPSPSGLTLESITSNSASTSWTIGDTETAWNIEWGTPGFTPGTGTQIGADVSAITEFTITGLTAETSYDVYVQADCGVTDGTSDWIGPLNIFTGYCSAGPTSTADSEILGVTLNGAASSINNPTPCPAVAGINDYTVQTVTLVRGETYDLDVLMGQCGTGTYTNTIKAWIDYNQDLTLEEPAERLGVLTQGTSAAGVNGTLNFTVPLTATLGNTRLRVMMRETGTETLVTPCASFSWGSAHDYTVEIVEGPATPPVPVQDAAAPTCDLGTDLTVTGTPDAGTEWYWQESATGTETNNLYDGPYTVFANGTYYLRTYNSAYDLWSDATSVTVSNFPLVADLPPVPVAGANPVCIVGTEITMPAADPGFVYFWQTAQNGTSSANNADTPWEITETGTYYVATFETATNCWSETSEITVTVDTEIPGEPTFTQPQYNFCTSDATMIVEAELPILTEDLTCQETATASGTDNSGVTAQISSFACATGTIVSASLDASFTGTFCPSWYTYDIIVNGITVATAQCNQTGFDLMPYLPLTSVAIVSNDSDNFGDFVTLNLAVNLDYESPVDPQPTYTLTWFDAAVSGNEIGNGLSIDVLGTTAVPTATEGQYPVYVASNQGACQSATVMTMVNINNVVVELSPIDVTCNGGNNGSFTVSTISCGTEPFTYSIDGGAYGALPVDLTAGTYMITVQDDNGSESAEMSLTIQEPETVDDIIAVTISFEEVELSWNTVGTETEWVVEYGEAGFTPGTGTTLNVTQNPVIINGLSEQTTYDFYVSPLCTEGFEGEQDGPATTTTFCAPFMAQDFCENFASDSETQDCWTVINANGDGDSWNMNYAFNTYDGDQVAVLNTDFNSGNNDDWLITPQLTLTGNEVLSFFYRVQSAFEPNDFRVMLSTTGTDPADFNVTLMDLASYDNVTYQDTAINLSDYTGNVFIAWHVPSGGLDGWILYIDQVCVDICTPTPSQNGAQDVCRLDGTVDLNSVIVPGETNGVWSFDLNPGVLNGSDLNISALPSGTYQPMYVVTTACPEEADTVYATINVYGPSLAGNNGTVQTCNYGPFNLFEGLTGTVDLGGTWYNPAGQPLSGSIVNFNGQIPANYNYYYITSNNVCPADTAFVEIQLQNCASITENELSGFALYPNPTSDIVNVQYSGVSTTVEMVLVDTKGSVVYNQKVNLSSDDNVKIDLSELVKGVYFLNIYGEESSKVIKIVRN